MNNRQLRIIFSRKTLSIALFSLIIIASVETMYILYELNKKPSINPCLEKVLAHRDIVAPQSGNDVYEDLEILCCNVKQLETHPYSYDLYLTDYSAFLILVEGKEVFIDQGFSFSWEPLTLYWNESIALYADSSSGVIKWEETYSENERITRDIKRKGILLPIEIVAQRRLFDTIKHQLSRRDAIILGSYFLQDLGYDIGKSTSTTLETREPNYYWHEIGGLEKPDIQEERECWVFTSYFPADSPIRVLEIWVDAYTGTIIGGGKS